MPKNRNDLTAEKLRELLSYDPYTGFFRWRSNGTNGIVAGEIAGSGGIQGYRRITIAGRDYRAHRLAWLYVHGEWPAPQIDHKNRARGDNRIDNLRPATHAQNNQNRGVSSANTSGHTGVCWHRVKLKWHARIKINGRYKHLGYFDLIDGAIEARASAKARDHTFQPF